MVIRKAIMISFFLVLAPWLHASAQEADVFYKGKIIAVVSENDERDLNIAGAPAFTQVLTIEILSGSQAGRRADFQYGGLQDKQRLAAGDRVVLLAPGGTEDIENFYIFERYRLPALYAVGGIFFAVVVLFARWRGFMSLAGLSVSISVLALYIVPSILRGQNPLVVTFIGSLFIATITLYLAHGFSRRTSVALASTLSSIGIALVFSVWFVRLTELSGGGSEEAFFLQTSPVQGINLTGLLLGGIIIGALGVLDDITTSQAAAVHEIAKANPMLPRRELIKRGLSVGREHITSLVNTLALAYAGASFPALLLFVIYQRPFWVVMNTEVIVEEFVRTIVGSIALICAVPITTALAVHFLSENNASSEPRT